MRPLSAAALLEVWERGQRLPPARQALLLLDVACPEEPADALARLPVGSRDERLLTLRSWTFGSQLAGAVSCPRCEEMLELQVAVDSLRAVPAGDSPEALEVRRGDWRVSFRLPTAADLVALLGLPDPGPAELVARCVVDAAHSGEPVGTANLPAEIVADIARAMEAADPQAALTLSLACVACGERWICPFDIVSFFWSEIDRWARRTLTDVHAIASRYGWAEAEILAMSATRRDLYLSLIRG